MAVSHLGFAGARYDQDKSFGVENLRAAFNQVKMYVMELLMGIK